MLPNIFITGINGFIGRNLATKLANQYNIYGCTRNTSYELNSKQHIFSIELRNKITDEISVDSPIIIHTAALMPRGHSETSLIETNVYGTKNILDWAIRNHAKHFIYISSGSVYGSQNEYYHKENDPIHPIGIYGHSKYIGEEWVKMYHELYQIPVTIFRLFYPYGEDETHGIFSLITNLIKDDQMITINEHHHPYINPIHVDDIIHAIDLSINNPSKYEIYNLCGDRTLSFYELVTLCEKKLSKKAKYVLNSDDKSDLLGDNQLIKTKLKWQPTRLME